MTAAPAVQTVYEACEKLLTCYTPVATRVEGHTRSMVLGTGGGFYVLAQDLTDGTCTVFPWRSDQARPAVITAEDDNRAVPVATVAVIRAGVPLPQDGTMLGWAGPQDKITALIPVNVGYGPGTPAPRWAVMPHEDAERRDWPVFDREGVSFTHEMWRHHRAGRLVCLNDAVASTDRNVYWIERTDGQAPGYCDVGVDVVWDGFTIPAGRYAYWRKMMSRARRWPSGTDLLDNYIATDLAPHFR